MPENRNDHPDRAVRIDARQTILQLRVQYTIQTYFPIIRQHYASGTVISKEFLKCNDFSPAGKTEW